MPYPRVGHFWRNPVVLSFAAVMATAATITFAWRDTKSPGDLVELAEAAVGKAGPNAGPPTTASKWLYAVRDAAGVPATQAKPAQAESVVALGGTTIAAGGVTAAGASSNRFGFSGDGGAQFRGLSARTSSGGGTGSSGAGGGGGWGGVSGTAAAKPAATRAPAAARAERPAREPKPARSPSSRSGSGGSSGSDVVSGPASTPAVVATFGTPAAPVVSAVAAGAKGQAVAAAAGGIKPSLAPSPAPEPMSLLMIGTGLAGAFGLRRRLKQ